MAVIIENMNSNLAEVRDSVRIYGEIFSVYATLHNRYKLMAAKQREPPTIEELFIATGLFSAYELELEELLLSTLCPPVQAIVGGDCVDLQLPDNKGYGIIEDITDKIKECLQADELLFKWFVAEDFYRNKSVVAIPINLLQYY